MNQFFEILDRQTTTLDRISFLHLLSDTFHSPVTKNIPATHLPRVSIHVFILNNRTTSQSPEILQIQAFLPPFKVLGRYIAKLRSRYTYIGSSIVPEGRTVNDVTTKEGRKEAVDARRGRKSTVCTCYTAGRDVCTVPPHNAEA